MVTWTARARADLKASHDYIAKDSPINAKSVVREILRKADTLAVFPHIGRKVPEIDRPDLREISAHSWRIIYQVKLGQVFVVTLIHKRRQVDAHDIPPGEIAPE